MIIKEATESQIAPTIEVALTNIAASLQATIAIIIPAASAPPSTFIPAEIAALISAINEIRATIEKLQATLLLTVNLSAGKQKSIDLLSCTILTSAPETRTLIESEIAVVLNTLSALVAPISVFVSTLVVKAGASAALVADLRAAASSLVSITASITAPITGLLATLVGTYQTGM